ncbi:MAG: hypothetical protein NC318_00325 [Blautia sp.]|nr:hypothetical protein [Blautia sp.]
MEEFACKFFRVVAEAGVVRRRSGMVTLVELDESAGNGRCKQQNLQKGRV